MEEVHRRQAHWLRMREEDHGVVLNAGHVVVALDPAAAGGTVGGLAPLGPTATLEARVAHNHAMRLSKVRVAGEPQLQPHPPPPPPTPTPHRHTCM
jgi:hypothetical protein